MKKREELKPHRFQLVPAEAGGGAKAGGAAGEAGDFVDQAMYLITAPYLFYPPWEDIWSAGGNRIRAQTLRFAHAKKIFETEECTEFEAMLYISTATLEHPISHDWYCIYTWLFWRWGPEQAAQVFDGQDGQKLSANR